MAWVFNPFTGTFDFTNTGGGGGGSPGGSSGQIQYNNAGAFGGLDLYYSSATLRLGAADVASGAVAQTLQVQSNTGAATTGPNFTIKGSAGTTAGGSIIFQTHNGTSYSTALTINSNGRATFAPTVDTTNSFAITNVAGSVIASVDATNRRFNAGGAAGGASFSVSVSTGATTLYDAAYFGWMNGADASSGTTDLRLYRDAVGGSAPAALALKNSTNPQIFRAYSTTTGPSYGYFASGVTDAGVATADTLFIGTGGAGAAMTKLALVQNGTTRLYVDANGNLNTSGDTAYSFGSGIRTVEINGSTSGFNTAQGALTFKSKTGSNGANAIYCAGGAMSFYAGSTTFAAMTEYLILSTTGLLQFQGTSSSFPALKRSSATLQVRLADDTAFAPLSCGNTTASGTALDVSGTGAASIFNVVNTTTGTLLNVVNSSAASLFSIADTPAMTLIDGMTITVGTTTGTKIGTATSQKIGFWNATPIVQPTTAVAAATVAATGTGDVVAASTTFDGYTIPQIVKAMRNAGLLA